MRWRLIWRSARASRTPPFPGSPVEWDINKQRLVYWTSLYEGVYNHINRPPKWVIEDDELLDKWLEEQQRRDEERAEEEYKKGKKGRKGLSAKDNELVIELDRSKGRYSPYPS